MKRLRKQKTFFITLGLVSLAVFLWAASMAISGDLSDLEKSLLVGIYDNPSNIDPLVLAITQLGSAWLLIGLSIWLLIGRQHSQHKGRVILISGVVTFVLIETAKRIIARPRPAELLAELVQKEPFVTGHGFPSGHTALATVLSLTAVMYMKPKWRWLPLVWIGLVGWSRVYLGVHAPLDIVGGLSLGLLIISVQRLLKVK